MKNLTCILAFLLLTTLSYGQKSSLLQNVNVRAKELKHKLNKTGDSLILMSDKVIEKVEIYNSNYGEKFMVFNHDAKIPLTNMPSGRYVTEVKLRGKLILITLLVEGNLDPKPFTKMIVSKPKKDRLEESHDLFGNANRRKSSYKKNAIKEISKAKEIVSVENVNSVEKSSGNLNRPLANVPVKKIERKVRFYWIISNINKGNSSSKMMRMGEKDVVDRMIQQNKIDLKSKAGKRNELTIWEVYDTSKFMRFRRLNPDFANAKEADCFNVVPIYRSGS